MTKGAKKRTVEEIDAEKATKKQRLETNISEMEAIGWKEVDLSTQSLSIIENTEEESYVLFHSRSKKEILDIFLTFYDRNLIEKIWNRNDWFYKKDRRINGERLDIVLIYQFLAVFIRVIVQQEAKTTRVAIKEASDYFADKYGVKSGHKGQDILQYLMAHFIITSVDFPDISNNFQSIVRSPGQWLAGDDVAGENVPSDERANFELSGTLSNGMAYILYIKMVEPWIQLGETINMSEIVAEWVTVIKRYNYEKNTILYIMDSNHLSPEAIQVLEDAEVKYVADFSPDGMQALYDFSSVKVKEAGDFSCCYNNNTHESVANIWHQDKKIGKKLVISNAFQLKQDKSPARSIPIFDDYFKVFNACDKHNGNMHDKVWDRKCGGYKLSGDEGKQNLYAMACILNNTRNYRLAVKNLQPTEYTFKDFCIELSDALYSLSCKT